MRIKKQCWFAPTANIEAGRYELYFIPGNTEQMNTKGCKIIELIDKDSLSFTWKGPNQFNDLMNTEDHLTEVQVKLEELDEQNTRIMIQHTGFQNNELWKEAIDWHKSLERRTKQSKELGKGSSAARLARKRWHDKRRAPTILQKES